MKREYNFEEVMLNIKKGETYESTEDIYNLETITKGDIGIIFNKESKFLVSGVDDKQRFIKVKPSVSLAEVISQDKRCKIENDMINQLIEEDGQNFLWLTEYQYLKDIMCVISEEFNKTAFNEILRNAKWYLED
jgi:hypothetical protein